MTPTDQRDIPDHVASCSVYKVGGRRKKKEEGDIWSLSSQVIIMHDGALLSWGWLNTCLPMGGGELILCFAWLVCSAFAFPVKLSLPQPTSFPAFTLLILSLIPLVGSEQTAAWGLVNGWS